MRLIKWIGAAVASAGLLLGAGAAAAQSAVAVERSGVTFHVRVCPTPGGPGEARCHAHVVTDRAGNAIEHSAVTRNVSPSGFAPADLRAAYLITSAVGNPGSGPTVAIVDAYGYNNAETDLNTYRNQFGLGACTSASGCFKKVNQNGSTNRLPSQNTGWAQETALDLEMVSAMCPNCKILLVEASTASYVNLATAENTAAALGAIAISNSYGGGESGTSSYESAYNHPGVAITVSTGDSGYSAGPQFPATSPHVTAVGGTSLYRASNSRGWTESAWSGAGSGCSTVYAKPTWQKDTGCVMRMEADVSAIADPNTGVAVYGPVTSTRSGWLVFGGTSVAAPLIGGIYGANAAAGGAKATYGSDPYSHVGALYDVTSGNNGSCSGYYFCTAGTGYDGPTGLGTPNGATAF